MPRSNAPYDDGYSTCECFWGRDPATLVKRVATLARQNDRKLVALDAGCGDGKNAAFLASYGFNVLAVDISQLALTRANGAWPDAPVAWLCADIRSLEFVDDSYNIVVSTGMLHCLESPRMIFNVLGNLRQATCLGGFNVISMFNDRSHDMRAHPRLQPTLVPHDAVVATYADWDIIHSSDETLDDVHPHNNIRHHHSITRILARRRE